VLSYLLEALIDVNLKTWWLSQKSSIARFQYSVLADAVNAIDCSWRRSNTVEDRRPHSNAVDDLQRRSNAFKTISENATVISDYLLCIQC